MQGVQVWPLVRELRSHMAWPKNKDLKIKNKPTTKKPQFYIGKDKKRNKVWWGTCSQLQRMSRFLPGMKKQGKEAELAGPSEKQSWGKKDQPGRKCDWGVMSKRWEKYSRRQGKIPHFPPSNLLCVPAPKESWKYSQQISICWAGQRTVEKDLCGKDSGRIGRAWLGGQSC